MVPRPYRRQRWLETYHFDLLSLPARVPDQDIPSRQNFPSQRPWYLSLLHCKSKTVSCFYWQGHHVYEGGETMEEEAEGWSTTQSRESLRCPWEMLLQQGGDAWGPHAAGKQQATTRFCQLPVQWDKAAAHRENALVTRGLCEAHGYLHMVSWGAVQSDGHGHMVSQAHHPCMGRQCLWERLKKNPDICSDWEIGRGRNSLPAPGSNQQSPGAWEKSIVEYNSYTEIIP